MLPDSDKVIEIIRRAAAELIMPRFRQLSDGQIQEKSPGDLVTIADIESEKLLEEELSALVPGSQVVGEEAAEHDPAIIDKLKGQTPVWVIDPLDGTRNFAQGREPFAVIIAYCQGAETLMGWIHDPISDQTVWAAKGQGCWLGSRRLELPQTLALEAMKGSLSPHVAGRLKDVAGAPRDINRVGCVGRDYMDLAIGRLQFARYAYRLKPWDHAAGVLIHNEAGGVNHLLREGRQYHPDLSPKEVAASNEILTLACDKVTLDRLSAMLKD